MPTMKPFTFFGARHMDPAGLTVGHMFSGFPRTSYVDVSDYDFWVTLGGTQKGQQPTPEAINLSLERAVKLYWRTHLITVTGHADMWYDFPGWSGSASVTGPIDAIITDRAEPKDRCSVQPAGENRKEVISGAGIAEIQGALLGASGGGGNVSRMFDGETFVGYGFLRFCWVAATSYLEDSTVSRTAKQYESFARQGVFETLSYATIGEFPFVESLSVSSNHDGEEVGGSTSVEISAIEFWDLPS